MAKTDYYLTNLIPAKKILTNSSMMGHSKRIQSALSTKPCSYNDRIIMIIVLRI